MKACRLLLLVLLCGCANKPPPVQTLKKVARQRSIVATDAPRISRSIQVADTATAIATLVWDPNTEPDIAGYRVEYSPISGGQRRVLSPLLTGTSYAIKGFNFRLYYRVCAVNTLGVKGGPSNEVYFP